MEAAHCGFQVAMRLNLLAMYSLRIDLATAENVRGSGVKCTGSRSTGKVSSKYRSKSWGHNVMMRQREVHSSMPITTSILR